MSNLFLYNLVAVVSLGVSIYAIYRKRNTYPVSTMIVFYLFVVGSTWIGEFIVLGLFNSYAYKTGVFTNPWAQNLLGHLILNTSLYPTAAIVMAVYFLRYRWIALFAAIFLLLEYLFLKQGIYEHHWWKYYMTAIVVVLYLSISRYLFPKMLHTPSKAVRIFTLYFVAMLIEHTPAPILLLLGKQHFQFAFAQKLFGDYYRTSIFLAFIGHLALSGVSVFFVSALKKWYWKMVPFVVSITVLSVDIKTHVLVIHSGWRFIYYLLLQQGCIAVFILIDKYTLKPGDSHINRLQK